jgi:hypothetical protein
MKRTSTSQALAALVSLAFVGSAFASDPLLDEVLTSNEAYRNDLGTVGYLVESITRLPMSSSSPEPCNVKNALVIGNGFSFRSRTSSATCDRPEAKVGPVTVFVDSDKVLLQRSPVGRWTEHHFPCANQNSQWETMSSTLSAQATDFHSIGFRLPSPQIPIGPRAESLSEEIQRRASEGWVVTTSRTSSESVNIDMSHATKGQIHVEMDDLEYYVPTLVLRFDHEGGLRQRVELSYQTATDLNGDIVPICIYLNFEAHSPEFAARGGNSLAAASTLTVSDYEFIDSPTGSGTGAFALERPMPAQVASSTGFNLINP